jgi:rhodanese-related sulfurtransferase
MKNLILTAGLILGFAINAGAKTEAFKIMNTQELKTALAKDSKQVFIFDANNDSTRSKDGIIPGAKLLSNISGYDVSKTLPADKAASLVFYCANQQCTASHTAAKRAAAAGYKNVNVMSDGIEGWKKAGEKVETITSPQI